MDQSEDESPVVEVAQAGGPPPGPGAAFWAALSELPE